MSASITAHLYFVAGALLGVAAVLYAVASRAVRARRADRSAGKLPTFYINLLLTNKQDKKGVIQNKVNEKVSHGIFGLRRKLAASLAARAVSDATFTRQVAGKLAAGMPEKMAMRDITAEARVRFVQRNYAVVACSILAVDTMKLLGAKLDAGRLSKFNTMLSLLGSCGMRDSAEFALESQLVQMVEVKLREAMADEIMFKLKNEGGVESHVELKSEAEQPGFFYGVLEDIGNKKGQTSRSSSMSSASSADSNLL